MPKSTRRKNTKLHCQHCAKQRTMLQFVAINHLQQDTEKNVYPFKLRQFLETIQSETMVKLPKFYAGTCSQCLQHTFFQGQNRGSKLEVIVT